MSHPKFQDLVGKKYGRWLVVKRATNSKAAKTRWKCLCDCGNSGLVSAGCLLSGHSKSCGCLKSELTSERKRLRPFEATYNILCAVARQEDITCRLTYLDYLTFTKEQECHYCGDVIPWNPYTSGKKSAYYLDRKDNDKGYEQANCVVCCTRCNMSKSNRFTYEEWCFVGNAIREYREKWL